VKNPVFWKAIYLLSRPISLGMMGILLVNDHLLRRSWPSWATGKIGDLAWLFFIPFVLVAFLAWIVPLSGARRDRVVAQLAFGLTGGVFALANTLPSFHAWLLHSMEALLGFPVSLHRDVTDLVTLVALVPSWWFWKRTSVSEPASFSPGWIALPLAALLTMANATAPNYGIHCLEVDEGHIAAFTVHEAFVSQDGGLSWRLDAGMRLSDCPDANHDTWPDSAERDFKTWQNESGSAPASQAERAYYEKTRSGNASFNPGPLDAVADRDTGNTIYAMGQEGVLVHTAGGEWHWVSVGPYRRVKLNRASAMYSLLLGEGVLALIYGLLCIITLALRLGRSWIRMLSLPFAWGLWALAVLLVPPALTTGYGIIILFPLMIVLALAVVALALVAAFRFYQSSIRLLVQTLAFALFGAFLFFLPYVFWSLNSLPNYTGAVLLALLLGAITLFVAARSVKRSPTRTPAKELEGHS
jgi:hypothetical protein